MSVMMDRLVGYFPAWAAARMYRPVLYIEGGWEGWLQADFLAWCNTVHDTFPIRRECSEPFAATLEHRRKVDWILNSDSTDRDRRFCIELKAQGTKYLQSDFVADVMRDLDKLRSIPATYPCTKVIFIATLENATKIAVQAAVGSDFKFCPPLVVERETLAQFSYLEWT